MAEVESTSLLMSTPAARLIAHGEERLLTLEEVESLLASGALVVDACRQVVRHGNTIVSFTTRPVLFTLARALGEVWPADVPRSALVARAFRAKHADESHRARLRVEIGRLRFKLRRLADVSATTLGFALAPRRARKVVVLAPPVDRSACVGARLPGGRRIVVELGTVACNRSQRADRAARAQLARDNGQGTVVWSRASASLDDPAGAGFHDNLVTPRSATGRLGSRA